MNVRNKLCSLEKHQNIREKHFLKCLLFSNVHGRNHINAATALRFFSENNHLVINIDKNTGNNHISATNVTRL